MELHDKLPVAEDSFEETILYYSLFKHELKCLAAFNVNHKTIRLDLKLLFWLRQEAQEVTLCVCPSVRLCVCDICALSTLSKRAILRLVTQHELLDGTKFGPFWS